VPRRRARAIGSWGWPGGRSRESAQAVVLVLRPVAPARRGSRVRPSGAAVPSQAAATVCCWMKREQHDHGVGIVGLPGRQGGGEPSERCIGRAAEQTDLDAIVVVGECRRLMAHPCHLDVHAIHTRPGGLGQAQRSGRPVRERGLRDRDEVVRTLVGFTPLTNGPGDVTIIRVAVCSTCTAPLAAIVAVHDTVDDRLAHRGLRQIGDLELNAAGDVHGGPVQACVYQLEDCAPVLGRSGPSRCSLTTRAPAGVRR
jgi:hypothetical protein